LTVFCVHYDRWQDESANAKLLFWNHYSNCWCCHLSYDLGRGHFVFLRRFLATPFRFYFPCFLCLVMAWGKVTNLSLAFMGTGTTFKLQIDAHITVQFFMCYIPLHCLLFNAQHCCHHLLRKVANNIQEILHSNEYYHKDGVRL
jgi:hypothetical protein